MSVEVKCQDGVIAINTANICQMAKRIFIWPEESTFANTWELHILYVGSSLYVQITFSGEMQLDTAYDLLKNSIK